MPKQTENAKENSTKLTRNTKTSQQTCNYICWGIAAMQLKSFPLQLCMFLIPEAVLVETVVESLEGAPIGVLLQ
eukprot:1292139-Amphidinium_carterae.1